MRYEYHRPTLKIKNWFVTQNHIKKLYDFFKERFDLDFVQIKLNTEVGNARIYDNYDEFVENIAHLEADKEVVISIEISERKVDPKNWYNYKQAWIKIQFGRYPEATFNVIGGDTNKSNRDWVTGTFEEIKRLIVIFEEIDEKVVKLITEKRSPIVFDPRGKIRNAIVNQIREGEKIKSPVFNDGRDILQLKPGIYGISIDLRQLWRKFKLWFTSKDRSRSIEIK